MATLVIVSLFVFGIIALIILIPAGAILNSEMFCQRAEYAMTERALAKGLRNVECSWEYDEEMKWSYVRVTGVRHDGKRVDDEFILCTWTEPWSLKDKRSDEMWIDK